MSFRPLTLIAVGGALLAGISAVAQAASPWAELKAGMNGEATAEKIGWPMLSTHGRGVDVWIYDRCGEAVFKDGALQGWTVPVGGGVAVTAVRPQAGAPAKSPAARPRRAATVVVSSY